MADEPRPRTGRPLPGEYADYASADIAAAPGDDAIDALAQLAEETPPFFRGLAEAAERGLTYAQGKWTLKEIFGRRMAITISKGRRSADRESAGAHAERRYRCPSAANRWTSDAPRRTPRPTHPAQAWPEPRVRPVL